MTYLIGFVLGCIVSTLAFNYLVYLPYKRRVQAIAERTLDLIVKTRELMMEIEELEEEEDGPILSPIQKIRDGS